MGIIGLKDSTHWRDDCSEPSSELARQFRHQCRGSLTRLSLVALLTGGKRFFGRNGGERTLKFAWRPAQARI